MQEGDLASAGEARHGEVSGLRIPGAIGAGVMIKRYIMADDFMGMDPMDWGCR